MGASTSPLPSAPANRRVAIPPHIRELLDRVGAMPEPTPEELRDVEALRCHGSATAKSTYRNVYESRNGSFVAKVKEGGRLFTVPGSRKPQASRTAVSVLRWYRARFGANWRAAVASRKRLYWSVRRDAALGGWVLGVWADGAEVLVGLGTAARVFPRRSSAVRFARKHVPHGLERPAWRAE
jgi:hypothetical protein